MIAIIDYGAGNMLSVQKAFDHLGIANRIVADPADLKSADRVVLPGVGAFGAAMKKLRAGGFDEALRDHVRRNRPFLGICLGMQMLFERSMEGEGIAGLNCFAGECLRFRKGKVPQIGWNQVDAGSQSSMFAGIPGKAFFYFIHGYYVRTDSSGIVAGCTDYHVRYVSAVESGNVWGVQFHPEKSGRDGLTLLGNWVKRC